MSDRFDFEQQLMDCWNVTKDIDTLFEAVMERDPSNDQVANVLLGMKELYDMKFDKLFSMFEELVKCSKL